MKLPVLNRIFCLSTLSLFSFSCTSDLDYDQANDIKLEPVFIANFANFDISPNEFVMNGLEQPTIIAVPTLDVFNDEFFRKSLKKVEFFLDIENTINRIFEVNLQFLDRDNLVVYTTNFTVPAYTGGENKVDKTEIFEYIQLDLLKRTRKIVFKLTMLPGAPLNENSSGRLKLRSSVIAYLLIE